MAGKNKSLLHDRRRRVTLTDTEERFVWAHVMEGKRPYDAVIAAGYAAQTPNNIYKECLRIMKRTQVIARINELREQRDREFLVDRKFVIEELRKVAEDAKDTPQKVKALELLGKHLGLFEEKYTITNDQHARAADEAWSKREKDILGDEVATSEAVKLGIITAKRLEEEEVARHVKEAV